MSFFWLNLVHQKVCTKIVFFLQQVHESVNLFKSNFTRRVVTLVFEEAVTKIICISIRPHVVE